ncbi:MAG: LCP family protein [Agathobacter rectalis]
MELLQNSEQAFSSSMDSYKFSKGFSNELNGEEALAYARERHNLPDGDTGRGRHQMDLISAVIDKMTNKYGIIGPTTPVIL